MDMDFVSSGVFLSGWMMVALVAAMVGESRGRAGAGFLCGLLLGPLGIVVALFLPREDPAPPRGGRQGFPPDAVPRNPGSWRPDPVDEWEAKEKARTVIKHPGHRG
jgi:hypothetical protein